KENDDKSLEPTGLETLADKANITKGIKKFLPPDLLKTIVVLDFVYTESEYSTLVGKKFQVLFVNESAPDLRPFISLAEGKGIARDTIYIRREGESCAASHHEIQTLINDRIEAG